MKKHHLNFLFAFTLAFILLGIEASISSATGNCKNTTCEGLNPNTMGCPATTSGTIKYLPDGSSTVETRVSSSSNCDAKWARTYNWSGSSKYAAASLRYGCSNYCYNKSISSPASIANGSTVYTAMHAYASTPTRSCGDISSSGPISIPIGISDTFCTGAN